MNDLDYVNFKNNKLTQLVDLFVLSHTPIDGKGPCFCKCHEDDHRPDDHSNRCIKVRAILEDIKSLKFNSHF